MVKLDFAKAEELVFQDESMRRLLPEFAHLIDQYNLGVRVPPLRQLGKRSILEFLEKASASDLEVISRHVGYIVTKDDLDFQIVRNLDFKLENLCDSLCNCQPLTNLCISRNEETIQVTFWR